MAYTGNMPPSQLIQDAQQYLAMTNPSARYSNTALQEAAIMLMNNPSLRPSQMSSGDRVAGNMGAYDPSSMGPVFSPGDQMPNAPRPMARPGMGGGAPPQATVAGSNNPPMPMPTSAPSPSPMPQSPIGPITDGSFMAMQSPISPASPPADIVAAFNSGGGSSMSMPMSTPAPVGVGRGPSPYTMGRTGDPANPISPPTSPTMDPSIGSAVASPPTGDEPGMFPNGYGNIGEALLKALGGMLGAGGLLYGGSRMLRGMRGAGGAPGPNIGGGATAPIPPGPSNGVTGPYLQGEVIPPTRPNAPPQITQKPTVEGQGVGPARQPRGTAVTPPPPKALTNMMNNGETPAKPKVQGPRATVSTPAGKPNVNGPRATVGKERVTGPRATVGKERIKGPRATVGENAPRPKKKPTNLQQQQRRRRQRQ